jgi:hypothetical protein
MSRSRELVEKFVDRTLNHEIPERVNEAAKEMLCQRVREKIMDEEYEMTEASF